MHACATARRELLQAHTTRCTKVSKRRGKRKQVLVFEAQESNAPDVLIFRTLKRRGIAEGSGKQITKSNLI